MGKQSRLKLERWFQRRLAGLPASLSTPPKPMLSDRAISLIGLFLSLLSVGGQGLFPTLYVIWAACLAIGMGGLMFAILSEGIFGRFLSSRKPLCLAISVLIAFGAGTIGWSRAKQLAEPPDINLVFVYPQTVSLLVVNPTDKTIQQPKYHVALWNLDHPRRANPLPIPTQTGDFIRPHEAWGPNVMLGYPDVRPLVSEGDHLFGFAQALCPECKRHHYYWVYIEHGKNGWFCELPQGQLIDWNMLSDHLGDGTNAHDSWISKLAPSACRQPVKASW